MRAKTLLVALGIWLAVTLFFTASVIARYIGTDKSFTYVFYATGVHYGLWALLWPLLASLCSRWPLFGNAKTDPQKGPPQRYSARCRAPRCSCWSPCCSLRSCR